MANKNSREEANLYDKIFKENLEELVLPMLRQYWELEIKALRRIRNKLQTTTEREADFLSEITDNQDQKFILHVEFQTKDEPDMIYRMQEYHGIISRKYQLPVRHFVLYFGNKPSKMVDQLPTGTRFDGFTLLDFKTIDFRDLLLSEIGSEIVLAILADFKAHNNEAVIRLILTRLRAVSKSEAELKKYFRQLNVLSRLRNLNQEVIKNIETMPVTIDIKKDYLYKKGLEQGLEQGLAEGDAKGRAEKTYDAAVNMLKEAFAIEVICKILEVSEDYVQKVKEELR